MPRAPSMLASSSGLEIAARGGRDRAAVARCVADAHERGAGVGHDHLHVGEVGVDETRRRDEVGDALHALEQDLVRHLERVEHRGLLVGDLEQPVVGDDDQRVDLLLEVLDPLLGLDRAAPALERERSRHDTDGQRAGRLRHLRDDRRATGSGAAALARGDEHHVGALEHLFDLLAVLLGGLAPDLGVRARAEPTRELATEVELHVRVAHQQRLRVGVDRDELHALEPGVDHAVDGVAAATAHADDLDHGEVVLR